MLGSDLLHRGGPQSFSTSTSFNSSTTTGFSPYGCSARSFSTKAGPRNKDLETGGGEESEPTPKNGGEMRVRQLDDNYRTSPGRHGACSLPLQGFGQERVNNDGECFLFF